MEKKEYIVTLWDHNDLDSFYIEMEQEGNHGFTPNRSVHCSCRRPISRNTHYLLTEEEAEILQFDQRVRAVELPLGNDKRKLTSYVSGSQTYERSETFTYTNKNWGLYRNFIEDNISGWGEPGTTTLHTDAIYPFYDGRNVDVIVHDSLVDPNHPEFAVNADGSGGSRVQYVDWFSYDQYIDPGLAVEGSYVHFHDPYDHHGSLVASAIAGNTQGLASAANIYNLEAVARPKYAKFLASVSGNVMTVTYVYPGSRPIEVGQRVRIAQKNSTLTIPRTITALGTGTGGVGTYTISTTLSYDEPEDIFFTEYNGVFTAAWDQIMYDYIRAFHRFKPINSSTGVKNPTLVNASYGLVAEENLGDLSSIFYRGTLYTASSLPAGVTWTATSLRENFGVPFLFPSSSDTMYLLEDSTSLRSDVEDMVQEGIVIVHAPGNTNNYTDVAGGDDYDNYLNVGSTRYYYHRGDFLSRVDGVIDVGAIGLNSTEEKASFSSTGPRIDVWTGGDGIIGAAAGTETYGSIYKYKITSNQATFYAPISYNWGINDLSKTANPKIYIEMDSLTQFNGTWDVVDFGAEPGGTTWFNYFTINFTASDVPETPATGSYRSVNLNTELANPPFDRPEGVLTVVDPRDDQYYLWSAGGTSFSAPNAAGLITCWLSDLGRVNRDDVKAFLITYGAFNKLYDSSGQQYLDDHALLGAPNYIQQYADFKPYFFTDLGYPRQLFKDRMLAFTRFGLNVDSAMLYPRVRTFVY